MRLLPVQSHCFTCMFQGGTIDFTVYEEGRVRYTLTELNKDTGEAWGGIMVDNAFRDFLADLKGIQFSDNFLL